MPETILARLRHEHNEIRELLEQIEKAKKTSLRNSLFNKVKEILVPHMEGEEKSIYAKLRNETHEKAAESIVDDASQEHHEMKEYLQRLTLMEPESIEWMREFHSFKEHVDQHLLEEETELFDEAKMDFTRRELEQLLVEFEEKKFGPSP